MSNNARAALWVVIAMIMISSNDALLKLSGEVLGVGQLLFIRSGFATLVFALIIRMSGRPVFSRHVLDRRNLVRAGCECMATFCFVVSLTLLSLAVASTLIWIAPILMTVCSAVYLRQPVSRARWLAVLAGFAGVLCITNPFAGDFNWAMVLPLVAAGFLVARNLVTQSLDVKIDSVHVVLASLAAVALVGGCLALSDWRPVDGMVLSWLAASALLLSGGFYLEISAIRLGELSFLAPFLFTSIVVAVFWGYVIWDDVPTLLNLAGIALIIGSGVYVLVNRPRPGRVLTAPKSH